MAHILRILPKGFRVNKKTVQTLSCMQSSKNSIQQKINCAAKAKQQLEADIFERENIIKQSTIASQNIK